LFLWPLARMRWRSLPEARRGKPEKWLAIRGGLLAGLALCAGINLQQIGLVSTTAGNAGFITGLYVVIVPILGIFWGLRPQAGVWIGAILGAVGLFFLSVTDQFVLGPGDGWVLACAFVWAGHVLVVGWLSPQMDSYILAFGQTTVCAILSLLIALLTEEIHLAAIRAAWLPIAYAGIMSTGVGFTLQVMGQRYAPPAHAAVILQLETVVAAASGAVILKETMSPRALLGAGLMLAGMLIAQLWSFGRRKGSTG